MQDRTQQQAKHQNIRLKKQPNPPSGTQIRDMQEQAVASVGRTIEQPFQEQRREYTLTVFKDRLKKECLWMLYRGEGSSSTLEWSEVTTDVDLIHHLICSQFTGVAPKPGQTENGGKSEKPEKEDFEKRFFEEMRAESARTAEKRTDSTGREQAAAAPDTPQRQPAKPVAFPPITAATEPPGWAKTNQSRAGPDKTARAEKAPIPKPILEGDLQNLQMPNLLQSIAMGQMTGRLEVTTTAENATIHFADGVPKHCELREAEGDLALVEIVGWDEGEFSFFPDRSDYPHTINKRVELVIMEGLLLLDQSKFLENVGIKPDSYLFRNHANISESLFEQLVCQGTVADMLLQKALYQAIDNKSTLADLLRVRPVPKPKWVPVIFNLVTCGLVWFGEQPYEQQPAVAPSGDVDWERVAFIEKALCRADTGMFSYDAMLYFLQREFVRVERTQRPLSLIVFAVHPHTDADDAPAPALALDVDAVKEVKRRVEKIIRKTDLLGHFDTFGYALMLPETDASSAKNLASRIGDMLKNMRIDKRADAPIQVSIGVATIPNDCHDLAKLLSAARPSRYAKA